MTYYGKNCNKGKQENYGASKSNNHRHGKFSTSRNRHKKMIKSSERWQAKHFINGELLKIIESNNI